MAFLDWSFLRLHRFQLFAVAALSTGITAAAIFGSQRIRREIRIQKIKEEIPTVEAHGVRFNSSF